MLLRVRKVRDIVEEVRKIIVMVFFSRQKLAAISTELGGQDSLLPDLNTVRTLYLEIIKTFSKIIRKIEYVQG